MFLGTINMGFKLSQILKWGKSLAPGRPDFTAAAMDIQPYLKGRGIDITSFVRDVRNFYAEAQNHYSRLAFRDRIAACLGLDVSKSGTRRKPWELMAQELGTDRKTAGRWCSGEIDPSLQEIWKYFHRLHMPCQHPDMQRLEPIRTGIARTLVFIRVFPPQTLHPVLDESEIKDKPILDECWARLRSHPHYKNEQRLRINQDALDLVWHDSVFRPHLWMELSEIGPTIRRLESKPWQVDPWFWPVVIFKYVTMTNLTSSSKKTTNPDRWIWDPEDPRYMDVWRHDLG